ncbi:transposase [Azotobacter armeniacus]
MPPRLLGLEGALAERVAAAPGQTLAQLCQWGEAEHGVRVSLSTQWKALARLGITFKKKSVPAAEQQRAEVAQARDRWMAEQARLDVRRVIFLDETWTNTKMDPSRGRAPRGQRCLGHGPPWSLEDDHLRL